VTNWYAVGFDTTVGSSAELSVYNPTATPAVFSVVGYSNEGYFRRRPSSRVSLWVPIARPRLNLGTQIVNTTNVGVHVHVLRGSLVIVGVQQSGTTVSLNSGSELAHDVRPSSLRSRPNRARRRRFAVANPGSKSVECHVGRQTHDVHILRTRRVTVPAYGTALVVLTPNPAIPAAGYATVQMQLEADRWSASLATGSDGDVALSAPELPASEFLVGDFTGTGIDAATLTNTSSRTIPSPFRRSPRARRKAGAL
jgi:hypothetical protein